MPRFHIWMYGRLHLRLARPHLFSNLLSLGLAPAQALAVTQELGQLLPCLLIGFDADVIGGCNLVYIYIYNFILYMAMSHLREDFGESETKGTP